MARIGVDYFPRFSQVSRDKFRAVYFLAQGFKTLVRTEEVIDKRRAPFPFFFTELFAYISCGYSDYVAGRCKKLGEKRESAYKIWIMPHPVRSYVVITDADHPVPYTKFHAKVSQRSAVSSAEVHHLAQEVWHLKREVDQLFNLVMDLRRDLDELKKRWGEKE